MNPNTIQLDHLQLGYGRRVVLDEINASIPGGKITVILGESGCGKSTLLRHILGLEKPMAGKIFYAGRDFFSLPAKIFRDTRRHFGVLFQDGALLGSLSLAENVGLPLAEHTKLAQSAIRTIAIKTLDRVGLAEFADFYPHELSGGMKKRGGLARAIVSKPMFLFCDEPTSGLDPINAAQMDHLLLDLHTTNPERTIIVVTHDLASVARIAEHVLVLHAGKVCFSGNAAELAASEDTYLRNFMDCRRAGAGEEK